MYVTVKRSFNSHENKNVNGYESAEMLKTFSKAMKTSGCIMTCKIYLE